MKKIAVIDEETGAELAMLGVRSIRRLVLCSECRFRTQELISYGRRSELVGLCMVNHRQYCTQMNPNGECEKFEPLPAPTPVAILAKRAMYMGAAFGAGLIFGALVF